MPEGAVPPHGIVGSLDRHVAQLLKQDFQLVAAAVQISDDVKRPVFFPLVIPERRSLDDSGFDLLGRIEDEDVREALPLQAPNGSAELRPLLPDDVRPEAAILSATIPIFADPLGQVEHQGDRKAVIFPGELHQRFASFGLDVGGVHDGQMSQAQPFSCDEMQQLERLVRRCLVVLLIADHPPASIRRKDLRGPEVLAGEGALARATRADEDHEG